MIEFDDVFTCGLAESALQLQGTDPWNPPVARGRKPTKDKLGPLRASGALWSLCSRTGGVVSCAAAQLRLLKAYSLKLGSVLRPGGSMRQHPVVVFSD